MFSRSLYRRLALYDKFRTILGLGVQGGSELSGTASYPKAQTPADYTRVGERFKKGLSIHAWYACMDAWMQASCMHADIHACIHAYMHADIHACIGMHVCIHTFLHAYIRAYHVSISRSLLCRAFVLPSVTGAPGLHCFVMLRKRRRALQRDALQVWPDFDQGSSTSPSILPLSRLVLGCPSSCGTF